MKTSSTIAVLFLASMLAPSFLRAEMPQDHWYFNGLTITGNFGSITVGTDGNIYAATNGGAISVFTTTGSFVRQFGTNQNVAGIAVDSQTNIYVVDYTATKRIKKFSATGELLFAIGDPGAGTNQFNPGSGTSRITIDKNDRIYVADAGNNRVQVLSTNGTVLQVWNSSILLGPQYFATVSGIAAARDGRIHAWVRSGSGSAGGVRPFTSAGEPLPETGTDTHERFPAIATTPDGLVVLLSSTLFEVYAVPQQSTIGPRAAGYSNYPFPSAVLNSVAVDANSTLYISAQTSFGGAIFGLNRHFGHLPGGNAFVDAAQTNSSAPVPFIESVNPRPGSSLVDIDYRVNDADSPAVTTALLAFRGNVTDETESLTNLVKLTATAFAEGTVTNLGPNQLPNMLHRVTWDASEASTNFATFQFLILANDNRPLLDFRFITLPASGNEPELTMSSDTVLDDRLLGLWFWLIATNDPAITFSNGVVKGLDGTTFASVNTTTTAGRSFLYQKLKVTNASLAQITRATNGTYGFNAVDNRSVVKLP